jgi:hypothetical protein
MRPVASYSKTFIPSFVKFGELVQELKGETHTLSTAIPNLLLSPFWEAKYAKSDGLVKNVE